MVKYVFTTPHGRSIQIKPGILSAREIYAWLTSIIDVIPLSNRETEGEERAFACTLKEMGLYNTRLNIPAELSLSSFKVLKTEKSVQHIGMDFYSRFPKDPIVILEKTSGYAYSNVPKLQLELNLVRGIKVSDCTEGTIALLEYLNFYDLLQDEEY